MYTGCSKHGRRSLIIFLTESLASSSKIVVSVSTVTIVGEREVIIEFEIRSDCVNSLKFVSETVANLVRPKIVNEKL